MGTYIIRRLLLMIPTVFLVTVIVFMTIHFIPGDVIDFMSMQVTAQGSLDREAIEHSLGLDVPIPVQYVRWIGDMFLHGSLGESLPSFIPVTEKIFPRLPVTFELGLIATVISLIIALPLGTYSAIRQDSWGDYIGRGAAIIFVSVPGFWVATMVVLYPSIYWGWSPSLQLIPFTEDPWGNLGMFIIPGFILGLLSSGMIMRMTRTMMLEVLRQDYIRTAYSKGLKERVVVVRHALKNAFIPVITIVGMQLPVLVGGTVIIEQIFALPGMGRLMLDALNWRDYPVISGINLLIALSVMGINLLTDLTYARLDPRVQYT